MTIDDKHENIQEIIATQLSSFKNIKLMSKPYFI